MSTQIVAERNKAVVRQLYEEVLNNRRVDLLAELVAEDGEDCRGGNHWVPGREGFRQHVEWLHRAVGDARVTVTDLVAEDDRVIAFWRLEGVQLGELFGAPATGKRFRGDSISWLTLRDGRIVGYGVLPDRDQFRRQLT
jgi:steroid delta-isomerase-like uncharacterized protein